MIGRSPMLALSGAAMVAALCAALGVSGSHADMIDTSGMQPWEVCGLCHGLDGISAVAKFPKLAGQRAAYIAKQFRDFHDGRRGNDGGQMEAITTEIDPALLPEVAAYFAALPAPPPVADKGPGYDLGKALFGEGRDGVRACSDCHDPGVDSPGFLAPWLEAQHRNYLVKQLADFASGARDNDPDGSMRTIAAALQPAEREALADFLAATARPQREP